MHRGGRRSGVGGAIREYRARAGLTQQELADRTGISVGGLRDLEQGRVTTPRPDTLRSLATAMELSRTDAARLARLAQSGQPATHDLRLQVLGPLAVRVNGIAVDPGSARPRALLGLLALTPNAPVPMDALIESAWGQWPPAGAAKLVQTHMSRLRQRLLRQPGSDARSGHHLLVACHGGYQLTVTDDQLDLLEFRRCVERARRARSDGNMESASEWYREATDLWRGEPLADVASLRVEPAVIALEREWRNVVIEYADSDAVLGRHDRVVPLLRQVTNADPLHEAAHARLMVALAGSGQAPEALAVFDGLRRRLADELGIDPDADLQELHRSILRGEIVPSAPPASRPNPAAREIPAQLPLDVRGFVGRGDEFARLDAILAAAGEQPASVVISAVSGTAGIGKTTLAVHWAHTVADRFPDGQLYVNLRGFDPSGSAMEPVEAVRGFLDALGVPPQRIPVGLQAHTALYRSLLAHRRVLVVLDNARDADQVRPLLPGAPGCLVVVTSRDRLSGLVAAEGAYPITLDLLSAVEGRELLRGRLGAARVDAEPRAVTEIIDACTRLPLALAVVAARAAAYPQFDLATLAAELRDAEGGLDALRTGDSATDVRVVFSWSYRTLSPQGAQLFRMLGLHPGPDIAAAAAASLVGIPLAQAPQVLAELARAHLVTERMPGRYVLHDLLRAFATELAHTVEPVAERQAAIHRMLDHYLHTADAADRLLFPHRDRITLPAVEPGTSAAPLADGKRALAWLTMEHPALLAAIELASETGFDRHAWQLAWTVEDFFDWRGHWQDQAASQRIALEAALRLDDRSGQARVHRGLGRAYTQLCRYDDAHNHLCRALDLYVERNDRLGQASICSDITVVFEMQGRHHDGLRYAQRSFELYGVAGSRLGEARALNAIGWCHAQLGDYRHALIHCEQALTLQQEGGDRHGEAATWDSLGYIHYQLGDHRRAAACYQHALRLNRDLGSRYEEAKVLINLGDNLHAAGDPDAGSRAWRQALEICEQLDHPDADQARARLHEVGDQPDAPPNIATVAGR
jgi:DNA-binding SARP family transcriptional activator/DNA-binding XRE family transcriptional regulator/Flp pilus assembly protein TadD